MSFARLLVEGYVMGIFILCPNFSEKPISGWAASYIFLGRENFAAGQEKIRACPEKNESGPRGIKIEGELNACSVKKIPR